MSRFNDAAQRVARPDKSPPAAPTCAAANCPLAGVFGDSIRGNAVWFCAEHRGRLPIEHEPITRAIVAARAGPAAATTSVSPGVLAMRAKVRRRSVREPGEEG